MLIHANCVKIASHGVKTLTIHVTSTEAGHANPILSRVSSDFNLGDRNSSSGSPEFRPVRWSCQTSWLVTGPAAKKRKSDDNYIFKLIY